ncbi:hypothetical protein [uncultured Eubacterium sp.]|uniref:hypothetical protein n=1 Tax=uncultured Eubacterium sp. TaxID=165185 RepID=UPI002597260B|nr:hypothetical protein [uncultured Eubacterium sp.]
MHKIKEALWSDYENVSGLIKGLDKGSDYYGDAVKERDNIRKELIELAQIESTKVINEKQLKSESRKELINKIIDVATFTVSTAVSIYSIILTFKFDQSSTITSTLGRNILSGAIPKANKR